MEGGVLRVAVTIPTTKVVGQPHLRNLHLNTDGEGKNQKGPAKRTTQDRLILRNHRTHAINLLPPVDHQRPVSYCPVHSGETTDHRQTKRTHGHPISRHGWGG